MEAVAATGPGCEAGKCSGPGGPGTGPDSGDFSESLSPAAVWSGLPEHIIFHVHQLDVHLRNMWNNELPVHVGQQLRGPPALL